MNTSTTANEEEHNISKGGVLGFSLGLLLKDLGCTIIDNGEVATIQYSSTRLKLEKRDGHWHDLEKNLEFYSRTQIAVYMVRGF